ncbi:MAG: diguanylate cyclase (GGDEF)-like protein/PAS domain S-box-containing protein [Planctomycetota bacterium]|jgi:diguanylate cyclase (GGDEF)-like protein/PAS domain S-box-containing protein
MERTPDERERRAVFRVLAMLTAAIFIAECLVPHTIAVGGLYVFPVILTRWLKRRRAALTVAGICTALTIISGIFVSLRLGSDELNVSRTLWIGVANHAVALFVIWFTAQLALMRAGIELRLDRERETTATTLESIAEAVVTTDAEGRVDFLNAAAERLLGWQAEAARGLPLDDVFVRWDRRHPEGRGKREEHETFDDTLPAMNEMAIRTQEGRAVPVEASLAPIRARGESVDGAPLGQVLVFRDISERKRYQEAVEDLAYRDTLTGLPNRNSFLDRLDLEIAHAKRHGEPLALLFLDMDGFKSINDTYGHHAGDLFLKGVAARLRTCVRAEDTVARLSGDEFTIILSRVGTLENARKVCQKIVRQLVKPLEIDGSKIVSTPSIGIALFPDDADDLETLLKRSDHAMYRAKAAGGARSFDWKQDSREGQPGLFDMRGLQGMPEPVARTSSSAKIDSSIDNNIDSTTT